MVIYGRVSSTEESHTGRVYHTRAMTTNIVKVLVDRILAWRPTFWESDGQYGEQLVERCGNNYKNNQLDETFIARETKSVANRCREKRINGTPLQLIRTPMVKLSRQTSWQPRAAKVPPTIFPVKAMAIIPIT